MATRHRAGELAQVYLASHACTTNNPTFQKLESKSVRLPTTNLPMRFFMFVLPVRARNAQRTAVVGVVVHVSSWPLLSYPTPARTNDTIIICALPP